MRAVSGTLLTAFRGIIELEEGAVLPHWMVDNSAFSPTYLTIPIDVFILP